MKKQLFLSSLFIAVIVSLCSCVQLQRHGIASKTYVSASHPNFAIGVNNDFPLISGGIASSKLSDCGILGGLPLDSWLAMYGDSEIGPIAIVAHAELPARWYWDAVSPHPFSVDTGFEIIADMRFETWTYVAHDRRNPFCLPPEKEDTKLGRWLVRCFARRADFDRSKIVLEYRERLPEAVDTITSMPYGYGDYLKHFAERARSAFVGGDASALKTQIRPSRISNIRSQYLDEKFWGTASRASYYDRFR